MIKENAEREHYGKQISGFIRDLEKALASEIKEKSLNSVFEKYSQFAIGKGNYRFVFSFDDDYIVKVAKYSKSSVTQNLQEIELFNQDPTGIYPKVYKHDPAGVWQIQEKVIPFKSEEQFISNFQRLVVMVGKFNVFSGKVLGYELEPYLFFRNLIRGLVTNTPQKLSTGGVDVLDLSEEIRASGANALAKMAKVAKVDPEKVVVYYNSLFLKKYFNEPDNLLIRIYKVFKNSKYENKLIDLRAQNAGLGRDGRFVIFDPGLGLEDTDNGVQWANENKRMENRTNKAAHQLNLSTSLRDTNSKTNDEDQHYGKELARFIERLKQTTGRDKTQAHFDFKSLIAEYGRNLIGSGAYRCVFSFDDDYVIKVARTSEASVKQNQIEIKMLNQDKTGIYPRVYKSDPNGIWQIQEKVKPLTKTSDFMKYFPKLSSILNEIEKSEDFDIGNFEFSGYTVFIKIIQLLSDYPPEGISKLDIIKDETYFFLQHVKIEAEKRKLEDPKFELKSSPMTIVKRLQAEIDKYFIERYFPEMDDLLRTIYKVFKESGEYKNELWDIVLKNCGVGKDGRFVIFDPGFGLEDIDNDPMFLSENKRMKKKNIKEMTGAGAGAVAGAGVPIKSEADESAEISTEEMKQAIDRVTTQIQKNIKGKNNTIMQEKLKKAILEVLSEKTMKSFLLKEVSTLFKRSLFQDATEVFGVPRTEAVQNFFAATEDMMEEKGFEPSALGEGDLSAEAIVCLGKFPNFFAKHYGYEVDTLDGDDIGIYTLKDGSKLTIYLNDGEMSFEG